MKKLFFIAAIASAALVSCTKNELAPIVDEQQEITFASPVVGVPTKGEALGTTFPDDRDFKVYAEWFEGDYTTAAEGSTYMDGVKCEHNGTKNCWSPESAYYWPSGSKAGKLTFAAFSPSDAPGSYDFLTGKGITFTDYEVTRNVAEQVDLLFTEKAYNKTKNDMDVDHNAAHIYEGIDLCFRHALCDIDFMAKIKKVYTNTTIKVKKIDLLNVATTGTFNQGLADTDGAMTNMNARLWTADDAYATYTAYEGESDALTTTAVSLATGGDLMLIPQTMGNASTDGTIKVEVTYEITCEDTKIVTSQQIYLNTTGLGYPTEWFCGKRYVYTIVIGLEEIYFDPAVYEWDTTTPNTDLAI